MSEEIRPTKLDMLFAAKAAQKEIAARVKALEDEVKAEFAEEYRAGGTDRKRSTYFGKSAGWLTMKDGKPSEHVRRFQCVDYEAAARWFDENRPDTDGFAADNLERFCEWWMAQTGECADGCTVIEYDTEPGEPTPALTVKEKVVLPMLEGTELGAAAAEYLLGSGEVPLLLEG